MDTMNSTQPPPLPPRARELETPIKKRNIFKLNLKRGQSQDGPAVPNDKPSLALETSSPAEQPALSSPSHAVIDSPLQSPLTLKSSSSFPQSPLSLKSSSSFPQSPTSLKSPSAKNKAYEDAKHFAGGIFTRPSESTKHFTIVRHSHGLVFYQGTNTSLAISVFADEPLPKDRSFWLQSKGWTGKTGMRAKALMGLNSKWIDVTPTHQVGAEQLNPSDERAWQRDIAKFVKKGPSKVRKTHTVRETVVVHIPPEAGDGYFVVLLCSGDKKILCPSPVFRVLSTSTSPHSVRGAGLGSLPFEMGAMALTLYAKSSAGTVMAPVTLLVNSEVSQYLPHQWLAKKAATTALGAGDKLISDQNSKYMALEESLNTEKIEAALEDGPQSPFPTRFVGWSQLNSSNMAEELYLPNFALTGVEDKIMHELHGYYFGWARKCEKTLLDKRPWVQAILSVTMTDVAQLERVRVGQKACKSMSLRLLEELDSPPLDKEKFEIQVMGFIRPDEPIQQAELEHGIEVGKDAALEAALIIEQQDINVAEEFLNHPAWTVDEASRPKADARKKSGLQKITQGYTNTKTAAKRQIDKVDLHAVGIRTWGDTTREKFVVMKGCYVVR